MTKFESIEQDMDTSRKLMCQSHNCPNAWAVDAGNGRLCSEHAWADPIDWGRITASINARKITAYRNEHKPVKPVSEDEKRSIIGQFRRLMSEQKNFKQWAYRLKDREQAGEDLSELQKKYWRIALGEK
jgi:hypothetical protein